MDASNENIVKRVRIKSSVLYIRWLFIALLIFTSFSDLKETRISSAFIETMAIAVVYNIFLSIFIIKNSRKKRMTAGITVYTDIVLVSVLSYLSGGITSDLYIFIVFAIAYHGINKNSSTIIFASIFGIFAYSMSSVLAMNFSMQELGYWRLAARGLFIIFTAYGIWIIINEVRKFDEMHKKEFKLARTDKLTGLANRHYFDQKLKEEADHALHSGKPLNILIFDLDNFKKFNDTYGHVWGDKLLMLFSDIIRQNIRKTDIPVRYGGEEFLLMIRDLDVATAKSIGDRIRWQLEKQRIYAGLGEDRRRITVSCGVAQFPAHSKNIKQVVDLADKALYHAKEKGKNVVFTYDELKNSNEKDG